MLRALPARLLAHRLRLTVFGHRARYQIEVTITLRSLGLSLILLLAGPAIAQAKFVAVLEPEAQLSDEDRGKIDRVYFGDLIRGQVPKLVPGLGVMTRENIIQLLTASGKKLEDCVGNCEVETGRMLGADFIVTSRLTKVGTRYKLTMRMHETKSGVLLSSANASGTTVDQLDDSVQTAVEDLLSPLAPAQKAKSQPLSQTLLLVQSEPTGATISLDGQVRGPAPLALERLKPGKHQLKAALDNYQTVTEDIDLPQDKTTRTTISLKPLEGSVTIASTEPVICSIAGKIVKIARSGVEVVRVPAGKQEVTCEGDGVEAVIEQVDVSTTDAANLNLNPKVRAPGVQLRIQSPDSDRWEVRSQEGKAICVVPCTVTASENSGLYIQRASGRTDEKGKRLDVPDHLPFLPGSLVEGYPKVGNGLGKAVAISAIVTLLIGGVGEALLLTDGGGNKCLTNNPDTQCNVGGTMLIGALTAGLATTFIIGAVSVADSFHLAPGKESGAQDLSPAPKLRFTLGAKGGALALRF